MHCGKQSLTKPHRAQTTRLRDRTENVRHLTYFGECSGLIVPHGLEALVLKFWLLKAGGRRGGGVVAQDSPRDSIHITGYRLRQGYMTGASYR